MPVRSWYEDDVQVTGVVICKDPTSTKEIKDYITSELSSRVGPYLHNLETKTIEKNDGWYSVSFVIKKIKEEKEV